MQRTLLKPLAATLLVVCATAREASAQVVPPSLLSCSVPGLEGDVRCGNVTVPEDRSRPGGRQIRLAVVIARATGPARVADPLVLLAGGPGQAGTRMGPFATEAFSRVRERRDIVLIDARGTGNSNALTCPMFRDAADLEAHTLFPARSVARCRDSLSTIADLSQYTTANIADDLEDVRRAFGWPSLNLYGTSYGSRLAFVFLRRHPTSARAVVLKAVAPPSLIAPMNYATDAERAFELLVRDCRAQAACAAAFPNPRADLDTVLARAAAGAIRMPAQSGQAGPGAAVSREVVASLVMSALQSAGSRAQIPLLLRQAALGDTRRLAAFVAQGRTALDRELFYGMHLSVMCGEDASALDTLAARRDDGRTFLGAARVRMSVEACANWIRVSTPPNAFELVRSSVPVLLVSGDLDPNTPPRHAEDALRYLPNGRHVVLRGVAHGWSNVADCGAAFVADFIERASARDIDVHCGEVSSAPPFATP